MGSRLSLIRYRLPFIDRASNILLAAMPQSQQAVESFVPWHCQMLLEHMTLPEGEHFVHSVEHACLALELELGRTYSAYGYNGQVGSCVEEECCSIKFKTFLKEVRFS